MAETPSLHPTLQSWLLDGPLAAYVPAYFERLERGQIGAARHLLFRIGDSHGRDPLPASDAAKLVARWSARRVCAGLLRTIGARSDRSSTASPLPDRR